jgi:hypothetical protein
MEKITADDVRLWAEERKEELLSSFESSDDYSIFFDSEGYDRLKHLWYSGCYLNHTLTKNNVDIAVIKDAGFVHGQRSFFGNPYKWAAIICNQILIDGGLKDKPGRDLAEKLNDEHIILEGSTLKIRRENYL